MENPVAPGATRIDPNPTSTQPDIPQLCWVKKNVMALTEPALFFAVTEMVFTQLMLVPELMRAPLVPAVIVPEASTIIAPFVTHPDAGCKCDAAKDGGLKRTITPVISKIPKTNPKALFFVNICDCSFRSENFDIFNRGYNLPL